MTAKRTKLFTPAQFDRLPNMKGVELVEGRLEVKGMGGTSSWVNLELATRVREYVHGHDLGHVLGADCGFQCFPLRPRTVRKPDVAFVPKGLFPDERIPDGNILIAPAFVVEVISPRDRWYRVERKVDEYLEIPIPLIWLVNPETRTVHVYTPDGSVRRHREDHILSADPVIPGFQVRIGDLFPRPHTPA